MVQVHAEPGGQCSPVLVLLLVPAVALLLLLNLAAAAAACSSMFGAGSALELLEVVGLRERAPICC